MFYVNMDIMVSSWITQNIYNYDAMATFIFRFNIIPYSFGFECLYKAIESIPINHKIICTSSSRSTVATLRVYQCLNPRLQYREREANLSPEASNARSP